jgi:general secretion pathway protein D
LQSQFLVPGSTASFGQIAVGTLAEDNFSAVIEALQTLGTTKVLSKPQISVVENEEAIIHVGERQAFVSAVVTQTQNASTTAEVITFIDVGVTLKVTPSINQDGFVTMKIRPEVSSVSTFLDTAAGNKIPIVQTSEAETTVMVQDGRTIVIGGLMQGDTREDTKKVPVLGDIPILKYFFQNWEESVDKSEIVIFLTPTIISGSESIGGVFSLFEKKKDEKKSKN